MEASLALKVQEIDWPARRIITSDNRSLPIVAIFDASGRPLDASFGAVVAFAGEPGAWITFKLCEFDRRKLQ